MIGHSIGFGEEIKEFLSKNVSLTLKIIWSSVHFQFQLQWEKRFSLPYMNVKTLRTVNLSNSLKPDQASDLVLSCWTTTVIKSSLARTLSLFPYCLHFLYVAVALKWESKAFLPLCSE